MVFTLPGRRNLRGLASSVLVAVLLSVAPVCSRTDPESGRIRILYIGDGWGPSPVPLLEVDPAFSVVSVPTSELHVGHGVVSFDHDAMRKFVRLYMPRTYDDMLSHFDLTAVSDANRMLLGPNHIQWIRDSIVEEGLGFVMVGGLESFGAPRGTPWTDLEDLLPVGLIMGSWIYRSFKPFPAIDHPFTNSLPWHSIPYFHGTNAVSLKQGAVQLLAAKEIEYPPLSYADYGEGRSVAHSSDWTPGAGDDVMRWEYYPDYVANIAYLTTKNEIPQDATLMHQLRTSFWSTRSRLSSVIDTINFVEKFGADAHQIEVQLGDVRESISLAERLYIAHEYEEAQEEIDRIDRRIVELHDETIRLKDRALLWIYLIEWMVTTGTALLAGFVLWTLMVRRRLYREVQVTRMA